MWIKLAHRLYSDFQYFFIYGSDDDNGCNDHDHDKDDYKDGEDNLRSSEGEDDVGKISRKRSVEKVSNL